jgi:hypothetical protein
MPSADELVKTLGDLTPDAFATEPERIRVRDALFQALRKVQSPWDIAWEQNWVNGATHASVKTLIDAGIFAKWMEIGGKPAKAGDLAALVKADEVLVSESLRQTRDLIMRPRLC